MKLTISSIIKYIRDGLYQPATYEEAMSAFGKGYKVISIAEGMNKHTFDPRKTNNPTISNKRAKSAWLIIREVLV